MLVGPSKSCKGPWKIYAAVRLESYEYSIYHRRVERYGSEKFAGIKGQLETCFDFNMIELQFEIAVRIFESAVVNLENKYQGKGFK